jgi:Cohesin loading factor
VRHYLRVLLILYYISKCDWKDARLQFSTVDLSHRALAQDALAKAYYVYALGAYHQGTGHYEDALACFEDDCLSLSYHPGTDSQRHLASLAAMNRMWIMQRPEYTDNEKTLRLMDEVDPFCLNHPNADLRGVWMAVKASITMTPPRRNDARTTEAKGAMTLLGQSKSQGNSLGLAIALKVTHTLLFNTILGDKAVSCLEAAKKWANFSQNPLWQSVVAGSFVEVAERANDKEGAMKYQVEGAEAAQRAFRMQ